jgi:DNA-binding CsgD family transcriptional regulator/tetratricopeptide (TPR) repeat protein
MLKNRLNASQIDSLFLLSLQEPVSIANIDLQIAIYKKSIRVKPVRFDILDSVIIRSRSIDYLKGEAEAEDRRGLHYRYNSQYFKAIPYHQNALVVYRKTQDTIGLIRCLNNLGVVFRKVNMENEATAYYLESLELSRLAKSDKNIAIALNGLGNVMLNIGDYDEAMPYFREALELEIGNGNKRGINYDLSNIGEVFMLQKEYDSALYYYHKALSVGISRGKKADIAVDYFSIGLLYNEMKDYSSSNEYFKQAIPQLKKYNVKRYLAKAYLLTGLNYLHLDDHSNAYSNIIEGRIIANTLGTPEIIIQGELALHEFYKRRNDFEQALNSYIKAQEIKDSVFNITARQNIAYLEKSFNVKLKDEEINRYKIEAKLNYIKTFALMAIIVILIILTIFILILSRIKRENNKLLIEKMRDDINEYLDKIKDLEKKSEMKNMDTDSSFEKNIESFGLTAREKEVLQCISKGLKNEEIANELFLSLSTVKTHTRNIFIKLDVRNRIEAVKKAEKSMV